MQILTTPKQRELTKGSAKRADRLHVFAEKELHQQQIQDQQSTSHQDDLALFRLGKQKIGHYAGDEDDQYQKSDDTCNT